jgi:hypothetical protein
VHLACDGKGRPLSVVVTAGQRHDGTQLGVVLSTRSECHAKVADARASDPSA